MPDGATAYRATALCDVVARTRRNAPPPGKHIAAELTGSASPEKARPPNLEQIVNIRGIGFHRLRPGVLHLLNHADQLAGVLRVGGVTCAL